jgi:hypothetical protein
MLLVVVPPTLLALHVNVNPALPVPATVVA